MAGGWSDQDIGASLERKGMATGPGKTWTAHPARPHRTRFVRPTSQVSRSLLRSSKKVARVGSIPKDRHQCFQALEEGVQNDSVIAIGRIERSTTLESISMRPSSRKRVRPSQRESA